MAVEEIPTSTQVPYYEQEVELDGVQFKLQFQYIDRDDAWYMTVLDTNGTLLRAGIKVVLSWSLLRLWASVDAPAGEIISVNQGEISAPPTLNQLGAEVLLEYLDEAEILAIGG